MISYVLEQITQATLYWGLVAIAGACFLRNATRRRP